MNHGVYDIRTLSALIPAKWLDFPLRTNCHSTYAAQISTYSTFFAQRSPERSQEDSFYGHPTLKLGFSHSSRPALVSYDRAQNRLRSRNNTN